MDTFACNERLTRMKPSASLTLMTRAKEMRKTDKTVIDLAGGEPDFPTPDRICMEAVRYMAEGFTHYAIGPGIPELCNAIAKKLQEENDIACSPDEIIVTPGGKYAIYISMMAILNEGDEVIILDPSWVSYEPITFACGAVPVHVHLDHKENYRIRKENLEKVTTEKTRMLILNYPNNPTGCVLSGEEADEIAAYMKEHPQVLILSDEIYERLCYDGNKSISMASYDELRERVITVNGFSKCAAMTGWRLGYLAVSKKMFGAIYKMCQHSISCVNGFVQKAGVVALQCKEEMEEMRDIYCERRNMFVSRLNEIPGVHCESPKGAFYAWVTYDINGMTSEEICEYIMEKAKVVGMPGIAYGETKVACMRFSFANKTEAVKEAAERIKKVLCELQQNR